MRATTAASGALVSCVLLLSACVPADPRHPESIGVDADTVSLEEYAAAFDDLRTCVTDAGLLVTEPVMSPVDNARFEFGYEFNGLSQEQALEATDHCEAEFWTPISVRYTLNAVPRMNPDLAAFSSECLEGRGLRSSGDERSVADFITTAGDSSLEAVTDCIGEGAAQLYPELRSVTVAP